TKTFLAQLSVLFCMAGYLGLRRGRDTAGRIPEVFSQLIQFPHALEQALQPGSDFVKRIRAVASRLQDRSGYFFVGRGYSFPMSLEGALKLKEIAYIHAEGYAGGEL